MTEDEAVCRRKGEPGRLANGGGDGEGLVCRRDGGDVMGRPPLKPGDDAEDAERAWKDAICAFTDTPIVAK